MTSETQTHGTSAIMPPDYQEWFDHMSKTTSYCHFFAVVIADKSSPIGYRPSMDEEPYYYTLDEADQRKKELQQQYPQYSFLVITGMASSRAVIRSDSQWAQLHRERLEQLGRGGINDK